MRTLNESKLGILTELEGYEDSMDMLEDATADSVVPAICMNPSCNYTESMEPDQSEGWCPDCGTNTMCSCLILGGIL